MIKIKDFFLTLKKSKIDFFTGVPDSLFSSLCSELEKKNQHYAATNEGSAIGLAIGYNLSTNKLPLVYLQNSGLGNIVNPITSLVHKKIYNIPIFLVIGWRGEINNLKQIKDEPQHVYQGKITEDLLKMLQIKYKVVNKKSNYKKIIKNLSAHALKKSEPVAILVRKNTFQNDRKKIHLNNKKLMRASVLKEIVKILPKNSSIISTTGVLSRELMEINNTLKRKNSFYCVGGMGHAIAIANGVAIKKKNKRIFCFDGDGAASMHLGAQINSAKEKNLVHILINNKSHDSVGAQKTASDQISFYKLAIVLGYKRAFKCKNLNQIKKTMKLVLNKKLSTFIEIQCQPGFRNNLMRPNKEMIFYKKEFIKNLQK